MTTELILLVGVIMLYPVFWLASRLLGPIRVKPQEQSNPNPVSEYKSWDIKSDRIVSTGGGHGGNVTIIGGTGGDKSGTSWTGPN